MSDEKEYSTIFKDDVGKPIFLTPNQKVIFDIVSHRKPKRNIIIAPTQWGKSLAIALGVIMRITIFPEKWAIVAPTERKAGIIMGYIIQHTFDDQLLTAQLDIDISLERLKRERSRRRLTFRRGGEAFILSAKASRKVNIEEALMGFGAPNLILDESSLIDDKLYATAKRMIGGHADNFILEIGNPFRRNHFHRIWKGGRYNKIYLNYRTGLEEGRYTEEFIEEMREEAFFDVLYECKFPHPDAVDERGYYTLIPSVEDFWVPEGMKSKGPKRLGVDVGRGGNPSVYVIRTDNIASVKHRERNPSLMGTVAKVEEIMEEEKIAPEQVFVDDTGLGGGVTDRLKELDKPINPFKGGEASQQPERYKNMKAQAYWGVRKWLKEGGRLEKDDGFYELEEIKYKEMSGTKKLQIEPKEELLKRGLKSPDTADALSLTFMPVAGIDWGFAA